MAEDADLAGVGVPQALQDLDGRGLAGAVGTDQAEDLPGVHVEVEVVDDGATGVGLGEPADRDDRLLRTGRGPARCDGCSTGR